MNRCRSGTPARTSSQAIKGPLLPFVLLCIIGTLSPPTSGRDFYTLTRRLPRALYNLPTFRFYDYVLLVLSKHKLATASRRRYFPPRKKRRTAVKKVQRILSAYRRHIEILGKRRSRWKILEKKLRNFCSSANLAVCTKPCVIHTWYVS